MENFWHNFVNSNMLLGLCIAFSILGLMNVIKPNIPYFSIPDNEEATRKRGAFRLVLGIIFFIIYLFKTYYK